MQNIQTIKSGLPCKIRVLNHSGDDVLTTFDNAATATCVEGSDAIGEFWDKCIETHGHKPTFYGRRTGERDYDLLTVDKGCKPEFDLSLFDEVVIQPAPLTGG